MKQTQFIFSCICLISLLISGCSKQANKVENQFSFSEAVAVNADSIPINEIFEIKDWIRLDNQLVILSKNADTLFYIYDLPEMKLTHQFGTKGQGPGEFIFAQIAPSIDGKSFFIYDNGTRLLTEFNLTTQTRVDIKFDNENKVINKIIDLGSDFFCIKENAPSSIFLNVYQVNDYDTKNISRREFVVDKQGNSSQLDFTITNHNQNIAIAYYYQKRVEFYNVSKDEIVELQSISDKKTIDDAIFQYSDITSNENTICILYQGMREAEIEPNKSKSEIEVFDWGGNGTKRLLLDRLVNKILISQDGKTIYAISPFNDEHIYLYHI